MRESKLFEKDRNKLLWEDGDFIIVTDRYVLNKKPTATLWHRCSSGELQSVYAPQKYPNCHMCGAPVPRTLVGFWELVRYGIESEGTEV